MTERLTADEYRAQLKNSPDISTTVTRTLTGFSNKQLVLMIVGGIFGFMVLIGGLTQERSGTVSSVSSAPATMSECMAYVEHEFYNRSRQYWHDRWIDHPPTRRELMGICRNMGVQ